MSRLKFDFESGFNDNFKTLSRLADFDFNDRFETIRDLP